MGVHRILNLLTSAGAWLPVSCHLHSPLTVGHFISAFKCTEIFPFFKIKKKKKKYTVSSFPPSSTTSCCSISSLPFPNFFKETPMLTASTSQAPSCSPSALPVVPKVNRLLKAKVFLSPAQRFSKIAPLVCIRITRRSELSLLGRDLAGLDSFEERV